MKRAIIAHCWGGDPSFGWYPYVKRELETRGFEIEVPYLPDGFPKLSNWLSIIRNTVKTPDEETILIGHSLGCITIFRYLESLDEGEKVGGVILVAPFTEDLGYKPLSNFFTEYISFQTIKEHCKRFVVFGSDNDPYVTLDHTRKVAVNLNAEFVPRHDGHFTKNLDKSIYDKFPEVVTAVEKIHNHESLTKKENIFMQLFKSELKQTVITEPDLTHYYGDRVRQIFFIAGVIMLIGLPFVNSSYAIPALVSILAILLLDFLAALVSPRQAWVTVVNNITAALGIIIFEMFAIQAFAREDELFFLANQLLALLFLVALYFNTKTIRGMLVDH